MNKIKQRYTVVGQNYWLTSKNFQVQMNIHVHVFVNSNNGKEKAKENSSRF